LMVCGRGDRYKHNSHGTALVSRTSGSSTFLVLTA
jgi:hypothetical protein